MFCFYTHTATGEILQSETSISYHFWLYSKVLFPPTMKESSHPPQPLQYLLSCFLFVSWLVDSFAIMVWVGWNIKVVRVFISLTVKNNNHLEVFYLSICTTSALIVQIHSHFLKFSHFYCYIALWCLSLWHILDIYFLSDV